MHFFTKNTPQEDPQIHQKCVKMGEHHWPRALFERTNAQKIDLERSKADFGASWGSFGPSRSYFGSPQEQFLMKKTTNSTHHCWPGGMREAIE